MDHSGISIKRHWLIPNNRGTLSNLYEVEAQEFAAGEVGKLFKGRLRNQKNARWRAIKRIPKVGGQVKA